MVKSSIAQVGNSVRVKANLVAYEILRVVNQATQSSMIVIILSASIPSDRLSAKSIMGLYPKIADERRSKSKAMSSNVATEKGERNVGGVCRSHLQSEQRAIDVLAPLSFSL